MASSQNGEQVWMWIGQTQKSYYSEKFCEIDRKAPVQEYFTTQKMKFSIKEFFYQCDRIYRKLRIRWHLLKKSSMENFILFFFIFFAVTKTK